MNVTGRYLALAVCAATPFVSLQALAQSNSEVAQKFIGAWKLTGSTQVMPDGKKSAVAKYKSYKGYIMYTADMHMCAVLQDLSSPKWKDAEKPTDAEIKSAKLGFQAYCGTYEVNAAESTIVHYIEIDHVPNFIGTYRKRRFVMHDGQVDMVVLEPPPPPGTAQRYLTWEKLKQ